MFQRVHYSDIDLKQWNKVFPNFSPKSLSCSCCGIIYLDFISIGMLQKARDILDAPIYVNGACRCELHNASVGGVPLSQHIKIAFDLSTRKTDREKLFRALVLAGFTTFGLYKTFIHTDCRNNRRWFGSKEARELWTSLLS